MCYRVAPKCAAMAASRQHLHRLSVVAGLSGLMAACGSQQRPTTPPGAARPADAVTILGPARLTAAQLVAWFEGRTPRPPGGFAATVAVEALAAFYIEEGRAEGVTGDIAFVQGIVETGWFRFTGLVSASSNNFAGIGATGSNREPASFPDARTGVRAQIQHLRAYADPRAWRCAVPPLHNPCVDPRFDLVLPKGRAPTWTDLGNGEWAAAPTYGRRILVLYDEALAFVTGRPNP
jgi:mannosyl-glycoprotein endo-beta-N-acetylglucosaminidase